MTPSFRNWLRQRSSKRAQRRNSRLSRRSRFFESLEDRKLLAANLITNGSFESNGGVGQIYPGFSSLDNWTLGPSLGPFSEQYSFILNGSSDTRHSIPTFYSVGFGIPGFELWGPSSGSINGFGASPDGGYFYGADGEFNRATLNQTVNGLTIGNQYRLDFYYAGAQWTDGIGDHQQYWQVTFGSDAVSTPTMTVPSRGFSGWQSFSHTFTATSTSQTLSFLAWGIPGFYSMPLLDGVSLSATNTNMAPTNVTLAPTTASLAENSSTTSAIELSTIAVIDDGQGTNTLSLSGNDAASFEIIGNKLRLKAGVSLDFETKNSYSVRVNVDDTSIGSTPDAFADFTLTITNVFDAFLTNTIVQKGQEQRSFVRYVDLVFSEGGSDLLSLLAGNRIVLDRFVNDGSGNRVRVPLPTPIVSGNTLQFDFGAQGIGGNRNTNVGDGLYALLVDYNGDGSFDDFMNFHRLFGDLNGDGIVNAQDKNKSLQFQGRVYNSEGDVNGDGVVNAADSSLLARAMGRRIEPIF